MDKNTTQSPVFLPERRTKRILATAGLLIMGLIVGALISASYYKGKAKQAQTAFDKQLADLKKSSTSGIPGAVNLPKIPVPAEVTSINGTVSKIDGNTLTVDAFFFGEQKTYTVTVSDNTKIFKREMVTPPAKPTDANAAPPSPFKDTDAKLSDIREKDNVMIDSADNIKDKTAFEAKDIYVQIMNLPAPPNATTAPAAPSAANGGKSSAVPVPPAVPPAANGSAAPAPPTMPAAPATP